MRFDSDLYPYLPDWFKQIADYRELTLTESQCFEELANEINAVADNFFFQTMSESAVVLWEKVFGIVPDPALNTLEFRRRRLLNRISSRPPYTLTFLYQKLDELIGKNQWRVRVDYPNYTLYIESSAKNQAFATEVAYTIGKIKPAHIVYANSPFFESPLNMSEIISRSDIIYNYKLGAWGLGLSPFVSQGTQEVIKMANIPSIQQQLLSDTANFVAGDITQARINGTQIISELTKETTGSTAVISYTVPFGLVTNITLVELLDKDSNVLTSASVYIPVASKTVLTHSIPVTEGGI